MDARYVEFEDIIKEVGGFGRYQKFLLLLLIPVAILSAFQSNLIHLKLVPDHWCFARELSNFSYGEQHRFVRPVVRESNASCASIVRDSCHMFDIDYRQVLNDLRLPPVGNGSAIKCRKKLPIKPCDDGWVYDTSYYWDSFVMHFNLVCKHRHEFNIVITIRTIASICGTPLFGLIADLFGRRVSYLSILITSIVASISPILYKDYTVFLVCQFIMGMTYPSSHIIILILIIEFMCPKDRAKTLGCLWILLYMGSTLHTLIVYFIPHWVWITALNAVSVVPLIIALKFTPESLQWLLTKPKNTVTVGTGFKQIMQTNHKSIDEDLLSMQIQKIGKSVKSSDETSTGDEETPTPAAKHIHKMIVKFLRETTLFQCLLILTLCFGVNLMAQQVFETNMFVLHQNEMVLNEMMWSMAKMPAVLITWFLIQRRVGRRLTNAMVLAGIGLTLLGLVWAKTQQLKHWLSLLGLMLNTSSIMITYLQVIESSPTTFRCSALTTSISIATLVVTIIKYIYPIDNYDSHWLFLVALASVTLVISFLATFLMETLRENMPQTVVSAEILLNDMKYWKLGQRKCDLKSNIFKSLSTWDLQELDVPDNT